MRQIIKISIIVPIYNVEDYIGKCIESIINQKYRNIEIILVDDGSTDRSGKICDEYAKKDMRVVVIHKPNGGLVSARKAGINCATGKYVVNVDGDDWIEENYIENFVKEILVSEDDIIWSISHIKDYVNYQKLWLPDGTNIANLSSNDEQKRLLRIASGEDGFQNDIEYASWVKCVRSDIYRKAQNLVDNRIVQGEDLCCTIICLSLTQKVRFIQNDGYHYIQRASSIVRDRSRYMSDADDILLQNMMDYFEQIGEKCIGLKRVVKGFYLRARVLHDFCSLQNGKCDFLYPYEKVRKGSRIILCGAGAVGRSIMSYLSTAKDYMVVAWIDSNMAGEMIDGWKIYSMDNIALFSYDYIVLATNKLLYSREMRAELISRGVSDESIAEMSSENIVPLNFRE